MGSGDIACPYFGIPAWSFMQKYIVSRLSDVWRWVRHTWVQLVTKYLILFGNHSSYVYCRRENKLWVLVTLHAIFAAFQQDHSCRNTLFPDSEMSEDELSTLGWNLGTNIWLFSEITAHIWMVDIISSGDIACHYFGIPASSLMQKYIVSWLSDI